MTNRELRDAIDSSRTGLWSLLLETNNRTVRAYIRQGSESLLLAWRHLDRMLERQERKGEPNEPPPNTSS